VDLDSLRGHNLLQSWAEALKDDTGVESLAKTIKKGETRDPAALMSATVLKPMAQAKDAS
jgi:hypothetical protein